MARTRIWNKDPDILALETDALFQLVAEHHDNPSQMVELYNQVKEFEAEVKEVVEQVKVGLARALDGRSVRYGDYVYDWAENWSTVCVDSEGFFDWLQQQPVSVQSKAFNPNYVRKSAIGKSAFDTFFESRKSELPTLRSIPIDKAPLYKQALKDGEVA